METLDVVVMLDLTHTVPLKFLLGSHGFLLTLFCVSLSHLSMQRWSLAARNFPQVRTFDSFDP